MFLPSWRCLYEAKMKIRFDILNNISQRTNDYISLYAYYCLFANSQYFIKKHGLKISSKMRLLPSLILYLVSSCGGTPPPSGRSTADPSVSSDGCNTDDVLRAVLTF